jgi:hypothetical protein
MSGSSFRLVSHQTENPKALSAKTIAQTKVMRIN